MAKTFNCCVFAGNLTDDPKPGTTPRGPTGTARLAVSGFGSDEPLYLNIAAWGKTGEALAEYGGKGKFVIVEGTLKLRKFSRRDGTEGQSLDLSAGRVQILDFGPARAKASLADEADEILLDEPL